MAATRITTVTLLRASTSAFIWAPDVIIIIARRVITIVMAIPADIIIVITAIEGITKENVSNDLAPKDFSSLNRWFNLHL